MVIFNLQKKCGKIFKSLLKAVNFKIYLEYKAIK